MSIRRASTGVSCVATKDIPRQCFVVPLFVRRDTSMVFADGSNALSHNSVTVKVTWSPAVAGSPAEAGTRDSDALPAVAGTGERTETISVQPELRLPAKPDTPGGDVKWELSDNVHPFWVLPRTKTKEDVSNCCLKRQTTTVVVATQNPKGCNKAPSGTETYRVELPYITKEQQIKKGDVIMLKRPVMDKPNKVRKEKTWVDQVPCSAAKKRR